MTNHQTDRRDYAIEQLKLGNAFDDEGNTAQAREHWGNIKREDDAEIYLKAQIKLGYIAGKKKNHDVYWYQIIIQQSVIPRGTERVSILENKQIIRLKARRIRNEVHRRLLGEK